MDKFKEEILKAIKKEVKADIELEIPPKPELGDYAFPCFSLAKVYKKNPNEIASDSATKIKKNKYISEIKVIGPYLNFFVNKEKNLNLYGIDPSASAFLHDYRKKIKIIVDFFNQKTAKKFFGNSKKDALIREKRLKRFAQGLTALKGRLRYSAMLAG